MWSWENSRRRNHSRTGSVQHQQPGRGPLWPCGPTWTHTHANVQTHSHSALVLKTHACVNTAGVRRKPPSSHKAERGVGPVGLAPSPLPLAGSRHQKVRLQIKKEQSQIVVGNRGGGSPLPQWVGSVPPGSRATGRKPWWPGRPRSAAGSWATRQRCSRVFGAAAWLCHPHLPLWSRRCPGPAGCSS